MIFEQFRDGEGCLSYFIGCEKKKEGGVIDPSLNIHQYLETLQGKSFDLRYVIDTHTHADHLSGAGLLAQKTKAKVIMSKETPVQRSIGMGKAPENIKEILMNNSEIHVDRFVGEGEMIQMGEISIGLLHTPGHTRDKGASKIPIDELPKRAEEIPKDREIVAYCASGARSALATLYLRARGLKVNSLDHGIHEWEEAGYPIEK